MGVHAVRNASGSKRWMHCPGSLRMADQLLRKGIKPRSSEFARLGTAAHSLAELSVRVGKHPIEWLGGVIYLDEREDAHVAGPDAEGMGVTAAAELAGWQGYLIDENMVDAVGVYFDTITEDLALAGVNAELMVEKRFNLNWLIGYNYDEEEAARQADVGQIYVSPSGIHMDHDTGTLRHADGTVCWGPMFGTNDAAILLIFDKLTVYDYKHGQGVVVEVEDNSQEMYYALGIAHDVGWAFDELELCIIQPRAPHADGPVRRWVTTAARLRQFEAELREAAIRTADPEAPLAAGDWCGFCPAAAFCPALAERAFSTAAINFSVPYAPGSGECLGAVGVETSDEDLQMRMEALPLIDAFMKAVEGEAMRRLRETPGGEAFGHKLVRKKSNRAWRKDLTRTVEVDGVEVEQPCTAVDLLIEEGFPQELLYEEPKLKGPAKVETLRPEKLLEKLKAEKIKAPVSHLKAIVAGYVYKPEGGIAIAQSSDPRPAVDPSAAAMGDFEVFEEPAY